MSLGPQPVYLLDEQVKPAGHTSCRLSRRPSLPGRQRKYGGIARSLVREGEIGMNPSSLRIIDNRNGREYEVPIENGTIRAMDLRKIKLSDEDFGLMTYDPAFMNTASCKSRITFIDGDKGI